MDIAVPVKGVPDVAENPRLSADRTLDVDATPTVLDPNNRAGLALARSLKLEHDASVHVVTVGSTPDHVLASALETAGDRAYRLDDDGLDEGDPWATAHALQACVQAIGGVDLVVPGARSTDGGHGQTGPRLAVLLDRSIVTNVSDVTARPEAGRFEARRVADGVVEHCEGTLPCVLVPAPDYEPSLSTARERLRDRDLGTEQADRAANLDEHLTEWTLDDVPADPNRVGVVGSATIAVSTEGVPHPPDRDGERVDASPDGLARAAERVLEGGPR